jgi:Uridine kinase
MLTVYKAFDEESDKRDFIYECEDRFEAELDRVAREIRDEEGLKVVTLSGPTCSGKTTTASTLTRDWGRANQRVRLISIDDFFRNRAELVAEAKAEGRDAPDFETVHAIDFDYFNECVDNISRDRMVRSPIFDFTSGMRSGYDEFNAADYDVVLFEGIQAIYPEVTALFRNYRHKSIFISVADDLDLNGIVFSRRKVRFLRRMVRDFTYRAASPEYTYTLWQNVARNEDKNILPYADNADVKIDSLLPYELFVIKPFALSLLRAIPENSVYREDAEQIIAKLEKLDTIDADMVPVDSVFREFIGPRRRLEK